MSAQTANEIAVDRAEDIEADDNLEQLVEDSLDHTFEVDSHGNVTEITVITTVGGPRVEINLYAETVTAVWDDSHTVPIFGEEYNQTLDRAREFYEAQIDGMEVTA